MKIDILSRAKKKRFIEALSFIGITKIPQTLVRSGKEKIRAFSGSLNKEQIMDIWHLLPIEGIGLYIGKDMITRNGVRETRITLDGMHAYKDQLTKRILILNEEQEEAWFRGDDIELNSNQETEDGFVNVRAGEDFVGVGKVGDKGRVLFGFLPKERRRKERGN